MNESWYDKAQICINGHVITSSLITSPKRSQKFCNKCGANTITECQNCGEIIRGHYHVPRIISLREYEVPSFCHNCGKPYPWTEAKLEAAKELSDEVDNLDKEERELLKRSLDDIVRDTPQTTVAATRFKRLVMKAGQTAASSFKDILVDIVSEAAKKIIWPS